MTDVHATLRVCEENRESIEKLFYITGEISSIPVAFVLFDSSEERNWTCSKVEFLELLNGNPQLIQPIPQNNLFEQNNRTIILNVIYCSNNDLGKFFEFRKNFK